MHCRFLLAICVGSAVSLQPVRHLQPRLTHPPTMALQQLGRTTLGTAVAYKVAKGGHKRGSLNTDGAVAAFAVAAGAFSCSFRSGITLLCFYKTGSMLTKYGAAVKQKLEEDYIAGEGQRGAGQVLACSAIAVACAILRRVLVGTGGPSSSSSSLRATFGALLDRFLGSFFFSFFFLSVAIAAQRAASAVYVRSCAARRAARSAPQRCRSMRRRRYQLCLRACNVLLQSLGVWSAAIDARRVRRCHVTVLSSSATRTPRENQKKHQLVLTHPPGKAVDVETRELRRLGARRTATAT